MGEPCSTKVFLPKISSSQYLPEWRPQKSSSFAIYTVVIRYDRLFTASRFLLTRTQRAHAKNRSEIVGALRFVTRSRPALMRFVLLVRFTVSYENEFYLHDNKKSYPQERFCTWPRFKTEACGISEMSHSVRIAKIGKSF